MSQQLSKANPIALFEGSVASKTAANCRTALSSNCTCQFPFVFLNKGAKSEATCYTNPDIGLIRPNTVPYRNKTFVSFDGDTLTGRIGFVCGIQM